MYDNMYLMLLCVCSCGCYPALCLQFCSFLIKNGCVGMVMRGVVVSVMFLYSKLNAYSLCYPSSSRSFYHEFSVLVANSTDFICCVMPCSGGCSVFVVVIYYSLFHGVDCRRVLWMSLFLMVSAHSCLA